MHTKSVGTNLGLPIASKGFANFSVEYVESVRAGHSVHHLDAAELVSPRRGALKTMRYRFESGSRVCGGN